MNSPTLSDADWISQIIARCYAPRPHLNPWEYAEKKVYLDVKAAADPGFYDSLLTPWTRRLQELGAAPAIDPLSGYFVHTVVEMKSSRTGFTEAGLNVIRWMPENQPGHVLFAIDSKDEAKSISKDRLKPTIPAILGEDGALPDDPDDMGTFKMFLRNMTIQLAGSYSEGVFANKWCRKIFLDECEVQSQDVGDSTPIDLARSRGTTVDDFQLFLLSKPKRPGTRFHQEYLAGTQEKYYVPCPHCGQMQELVWDRVKFDHCKKLDGTYDKKRVKVETYYLCVGGCHIAEEHKRWMCHPDRAEWRITNPDFEPGIVSQHMSDIYSPFEKVSWGNLALIWLAAQGSYVKIRHFINNHLGLPYEEHKTVVDVEDLLRMRSGIKGPDGEADGPYYKFGELPWVPHMIAATSDVQDDKVKWMLWAFRGYAQLDESSGLYVQDASKIQTALIDYGAGLGYADLAALLEKDYLVRGGDGVPHFASDGLVDSGWATFATYEFCIANGNWYPSKGVGGVPGGHMILVKKREHNGEEFLRYDYEDHSIKKEFYENRIKRGVGSRIYFPSDFGEEKHVELRDELMSERFVLTETDAGYPKMEWKKKSGTPNDWGDAGKMVLVLLNVFTPRLGELAAEEAEEARQPSRA